MDSEEVVVVMNKMRAPMLATANLEGPGPARSTTKSQLELERERCATASTQSTCF
jgi:hypothetical protein